MKPMDSVGGGLQSKATVLKVWYTRISKFY